LRRSEGESKPLTLGQALAAHVRLIVWCKSCNHRAEPDIGHQGRSARRRDDRHHCARLLRCTECAARNADFVVSGAA
jgi:hypothetical protein